MMLLNTIGIRDLPIEIVCLLVERIEYEDYISFILAFGSNELFVLTREANKWRYLVGKYEEKLKGGRGRIHTYYLNRDKKIHGKSVIRFGDKIEQVTHYRNGYKHGYYAIYDLAAATGIPMEEGWYNHGRLHGRRICYDNNGAIYKSNEFINGSYFGTHEFYDKFEGVVKIKNYRRGIKHGISLRYSLAGNLLRRTPYELGDKHGRRVEYFDSADRKIRKIAHFRNGNKHGRIKKFSKLSIKKITRYTAGKKEGDRITFYPNGNLCTNEYFWEGLREGEQKRFDIDGKLIVIHTYSEGELVGVFYPKV
jgi:antitoxin component YwqK of YwqJK toxin-antitoxin module